MTRDSANDPARFLGALRSAFDEAVVGNPTRVALVERCFEALEPSRRCPRSEPTTLPVCRHLARALTNVETAASEGVDTAGTGAAQGRASPVACVRLVRALAALAPSLAWYRRAGDDAREARFRDGHANAIVVGEGRLAIGAGGAVGVSLVAPDVRYPEHHHPPEELYLVLSPGRWRHGTSSWVEPGIGGVFHNTPGIVHAMHAGEEPLLAVWCLIGE